MKNDKIIKEELLKMKILMNYNTSLTSVENEKIINENNLMRYWLLPSGELIAGNKIKGVIPKGAKSLGLFTSLAAVKSFFTGGGAAAAGTTAAAGGGTAAAAGGGAAAVTGTFLGLGPVGWTILAVGGLAALGIWSFTKDTDTEKIKEIFDMCAKDPNSKEWKRFMSERQITRITENLRTAMAGLGTDENLVYSSLGQIRSPGDFCAVSEKYKKYYNESLFEAIDDDFDYEWDQIASPLVAMIEKYAKSETEKFCKENPDECAKKLEEYCKENPNDSKCKTIKKDVVGNEENKEEGVIVKGEGKDEYQYKKVGDKYFYAKKGEGDSPNWIEAEEIALKFIKDRVKFE